MILDRLGVRGKLNLLLMLPLAAVVLVSVPFVAGQIENARSSTATADAARSARQLGALVWELQRERLITADYLADPDADITPMLLQQQAVTDSADALTAALGPNASDELTGALVRMGSLVELRQNARQRGASLDSVARAYHAVIEALIDALRLVPQRTSDAEGTRQLTALDALLRANEESALRGMAIIATAVKPQVGRDLLTNATAQAQMFTERFVQQADVDQAGLVVIVDQGEAARRVDALVQRLPQITTGSARDFLGGALAAAESQAALRRLVQDQVTSQITNAAAGRASTARGAAWTVSLGASLLFVIVLGLAVAVSRSISHPLQRLTRAAGSVADLANAELVRVTDVERTDEQPPRLAAIDVASGDEIGELAVAFNRVQATAALMLERQVVTRRNVSLMFANVAQRTQNLVRRQLALIDELERDEQNARLLTRLYRLDHMSTRLRRNADNLLVVAGARDETRITAPTPLATVLRSALAEIEDYQRVSFGAVPDLTVASPLVADLVLLFAELLENATAFSPPESTVDVHARIGGDGRCQINVVDHGIGMTPQKLAEENRRLVERERLDIMPTTVLGLFVVGRLARRHGLTVELVPTQGGGTTASVNIPASLHTAGGVNAPAPALTRAPAGFTRRPALAPAPVSIPAIPNVPGSFSWFTRSLTERPAEERRALPAEPTVVIETVPVPAQVAPAPVAADPPRGDLHRRVPGAQLPGAAVRAADAGTPSPAVHDASAARAAMDAYQTAVAQAAAAAAPPQAAPLPQRTPTPPPAQAPAPAPVAAPAPDGRPFALSRRVPGAHLAAGLREAPSGSPARRTPEPNRRDPEAERAAFDGFAAGLARAGQQTGLDRQHQHPSPTKESTP